MLLYIDLCKFATFNRLFGHNQADKLLDDVEETLKENVRRNTIVYRWGGDEFLIFAPIDGVETTALVKRLRVMLPVAFHVACQWLPADSIIIDEIDILDRLMETLKWARD
jgi:diguanylate cyclase (GGDEF)-like protein